MVRQGNENKEVDNFRYVTKGTFDAFLYQMVEKKQASISQIFTSKAIARTCDDIDDMTVDFMQVKMAAVGDDRIRRQMELREEIRGLNMLKNSFLENKYELEDSIRTLPQKIADTERKIEGIAADTKTVKGYVPKTDIDGKEVFEMKVRGQLYTDKKEAGEAFKEAMTKAIIGNPDKPTDIAEYKGFKIAVSYDSFTKTQKGYLKGVNTYPFELGSSESGNITRIDNVISSVPMRIDKACNELERIKTELADCRKEVGQTFVHEAELEDKKQELERLTDEINADKLKGEIKPEQPENTADSKDISSEKQSENSVDNKVTSDEKQADNGEVISENAAENQAEKSSENVHEKSDTQEKTNDTEVEPKRDVPEEKPEILNIKWIQNGKKIKISFDSSAENPITAFAAGKEVGKCKPEELAVTKIPDNERKQYPVGITHCIKPLNIAFGSSVAEHITKFVNKVKEICGKIKGKDKTLFSRDKIMSDKYKPTSSKDEKASVNQQEH